MKGLLTVLSFLALTGCGDYTLVVDNDSASKNQLEKIKKEITDCESIGKGFKLTMWSAAYPKNSSGYSLEYVVVCTPND